MCIMASNVKKCKTLSQAKTKRNCCGQISNSNTNTQEGMKNEHQSASMVYYTCARLNLYVREF